MKNYLIILLLFFFIACDDAQNKSENNSHLSKGDSNIIKISSLNKDEISEIYTNYAEAFSVAKRDNKAVFILFSTEYCRWCKKLEATTLKDKTLIERLNSEFVVLFLNRDNDTYPSKYRVNGVPAVYFTDKNEEIFTSMIGYHKNPQSYIKWLNYIKVELSTDIK